MMRLADLEPRFWRTGGEGITDSATGAPVPERLGCGLMCKCPCGCADLLSVPFRNPLDGGPSVYPDGKGWQRTGDTFEALTLTPSIQRVGGCAWHGFLTNGEFIKC